MTREPYEHMDHVLEDFRALIPDIEEPAVREQMLEIADRVEQAYERSMEWWDGG